MWHLKQIEVENFKSWRGKQVIGPFMRFSCIIGPNGCGKSNVMDALSFVTGSRSATLRVKQLRELIHGAHVGHPVSNTARVSMCMCDNNDQEAVFCRVINGDSSEYYFNDIHVTFGNYIEELESIGIMTKIQNCLVFQGAVESIAMKNPKERTKMLEYISQSKDCATEYNMKRDSLLKATEDTQFHFTKKKSAVMEKNQVSQEKMEAERYQTLINELNQNLLHLTLVKLYQNEKAISSLNDNLRERHLAAASENQNLVNWDQMVKTNKKEHGRLMRQQQQMEKELSTQEQDLTKCRSQYIKAKVSTSHHLKKAEEAHQALKKSGRVLAVKEQELEESRQEMDELEKMWSVYERRAQQEIAAQGSSIELDDDQLERYKELKELARKQGAILSQQAEKLHWEVKVDCEKIAYDQRRMKEIEAAIRNTQTKLEDLTYRAEKLEEYNKTCQSSLEEYRLQEESLSEELQRGRERSKEVNEELGKVIEELGNARLDRHESKRQLQRRELLLKLCTIHPQTVYGRLCDLCSPINKKYQLAVTKVFGRYMNAIVVSSNKVAQESIKLIKEERGEPEMFLPIEDLDVEPLNERLREVSGAKMVIDVVQLNLAKAPAELRKVLQFVCGNALVCSTIGEAQNTAFNRPGRLKTVALDGTMFSKSGVISGGSSNLRTKAQCWDEKDLVRLKERREKLTEEIRDLKKLQRKESDLKQVTAQARGVQTRLKYSKTELENLSMKIIPTCQMEIPSMESELANLGYQIQKQQEDVEAKREEINHIKRQIDQMEDLVFSDFCAEIGVGTIREYEQEHLKQQSELDKKRLEFESQCTRLNAKIEYDQDQLEMQRKKISRMEATINNEKRNIAEHKEDEKRLLEMVEESQNKLLEMENQLTSMKSKVAASKAELDQKSRRRQEINKTLATLQQELMRIETDVEQKCLARHNMLLACKIQGIPIALLSGDLNEISEVQLEADSESTVATMDIYQREAQLVFDYSDVEPELRDLQTEEEMDTHLEELQKKVSSVEELLRKTSIPNLKALEKMNEVKQKLEGVKRALEASTQAARTCTKEFNCVKERRARLFNRCFEHVSIEVNQIYKRLCRNSSAQAILCADNPEEPYLGGISYNCVAPGKRFMPMDNLSGGEKAIAALALIFAIHSFHPAPFFVLDEVDAALDNSNIGKVTAFIREECRENMQFIIISLKPEFFHNADALLGVYTEVDEVAFSRILTLDMRPYALQEEDNENETIHLFETN